MIAGAPALCEGTVFHHRQRPTVHEFSYPVSHVWLDPDRPDDLCKLSRLWSAKRPAPARFRATDYGRGDTTPLGDQVREDLEGVLGFRPQGNVRMLSQVRRWGWLFNPITVFFAWGDDPDLPVGAVLEVTNTPWKERHRYAIELERDPAAPGFLARFDKALHVSPFLGQKFQYELRIADRDDAVDLSLDVIPSDQEIAEATIATGLRLSRNDATPDALHRSVVRTIAPTHRVSFGIHAQAARLWLRRVPFVPHPKRRASQLKETA